MSTVWQHWVTGCGKDLPEKEKLRRGGGKEEVLLSKWTFFSAVSRTCLGGPQEKNFISGPGKRKSWHHLQRKISLTSLWFSPHSSLIFSFPFIPSWPIDLFLRETKKKKKICRKKRPRAISQKKQKVEVKVVKFAFLSSYFLACKKVSFADSYLPSLPSSLAVHFFCSSPSSETVFMARKPERAEQEIRSPKDISLWFPGATFA